MFSGFQRVSKLAFGSIWALINGLLAARKSFFRGLVLVPFPKGTLGTRPFRIWSQLTF